MPKPRSEVTKTETSSAYADTEQHVSVLGIRKPSSPTSPLRRLRKGSIAIEYSSPESGHALTDPLFNGEKGRQRATDFYQTLGTAVEDFYVVEETVSEAHGSHGVEEVAAINVIECFVSDRG